MIIKTWYVQDLAVISQEQFMMECIKLSTVLNSVNQYARIKEKDNYYKRIKMQYIVILPLLEVDLLLGCRVLVKRVLH